MVVKYVVSIISFIFFIVVNINVAQEGVVNSDQASKKEINRSVPPNLVEKLNLSDDQISRLKAHRDSRKKLKKSFAQRR